MQQWGNFRTFRFVGLRAKCMQAFDSPSRNQRGEGSYVAFSLLSLSHTHPHPSSLPFSLPPPPLHLVVDGQQFRSQSGLMVWACQLHDRRSREVTSKGHHSFVLPHNLSGCFKHKFALEDFKSQIKLRLFRVCTRQSRITEFCTVLSPLKQRKSLKRFNDKCSF